MENPIDPVRNMPGRKLSSNYDNTDSSGDKVSGQGRVSNGVDPKLIEDLKKASQEVEGMEEIQPRISEIPKEKAVEVSKPPRQEIGGGGKEVSKKIDQDLENHLLEIVEERKILEEKQNEIQSRLELLINLENRIRRVLSERKKIDEDLEKIKNKKVF